MSGPGEKDPEQQKKIGKHEQARLDREAAKEKAANLPFKLLDDSKSFLDEIDALLGDVKVEPVPVLRALPAPAMEPVLESALPGLRQVV